MSTTLKEATELLDLAERKLLLEKFQKELRDFVQRVRENDLRIEASWQDCGEAPASVINPRLSIVE